ncbi:MAG: 4-(cytidine 5'-diphospho)-2-C-methyl-D-erythritol kinase [Clostridia bacterium]|nr:4-(cytidine 5'-diphospho)-2-C-methyl-D-erythritol kinase [Clostridia bacterium]
MEKLTLECRGKINLAIDVTGKRENGYHDVEMILQEIGLADRLTLSLRQDGRIVITSDSSEIPTGEGNLAYRAAEAFFTRLGRNEGVEIHIEKRIPMGAGLGGGSADAAGVLKGLNAMFGQPFPIETLMELGEKLGADVPFCVMGGCAMATGIGEVLTPLPMPPKGLRCVIAKPEPFVSTKWVYENLDYTQKPDGLNVPAVAEGIRKGDLALICQSAANILETVTIPAYPVVGWLKEGFQEAGAVLSLMSGSGSAVFGLFENEEAAKQGAEQAKRYTDQIYLV